MWTTPRGPVWGIWHCAAATLSQMICNRAGQSTEHAGAHEQNITADAARSLVLLCSALSVEGVYANHTRCCARSRHVPAAPVRRRELSQAWLVSRRGSPDRAGA